jgi:hypothetical protein
LFAPLTFTSARQLRHPVRRGSSHGLRFAGSQHVLVGRNPDSIGVSATPPPIFHCHNCTASVSSFIDTLSTAEFLFAVERAQDPSGLPPHIMQLTFYWDGPFNSTGGTKVFYFPASMFIGMISDDYLRVRTFDFFDVRYRYLPAVPIDPPCPGFTAEDPTWLLNLHAAFRLVLADVTYGQAAGPGENSAWTVPFVDLRNAPMCSVDEAVYCRGGQLAYLDQQIYLDDKLTCFTDADQADQDSER